jgi:hypothetical protein
MKKAIPPPIYNYKGLFEWMFQTQLPDQWYVAVNGNQRDEIFSLEQIRQFYLNSPTSQIQILNYGLASDPAAQWLLYREMESYNNVPWYRRSGINSMCVLLGLIFGIFILFTVVVLLTGDIYYNKNQADGTLKKWSAGNKVVAFILLLIWIVLAFFLFWAR